MSDDEDDDELKKLIESSDLSDETKQILSSLTAREAKVLREKFGVELSSIDSLAEIAKQFDVTRKRIREIEEKALGKLRKHDPGNDDGPKSE